MPKQVALFRVVLASPGDVKKEREALPSIIEEVNRDTAGPKGLSLQLWRWETDVAPGFSPSGPQGVIDPLLRLEDCDLLIAVFWHRLGTPTADGKTGTKHELDLAIKSWEKSRSPRIMVYFNHKPYSPQSFEETRQWGEVERLKEELEGKGLHWPYSGLRDYEKLVSRHLRQFVREWVDPHDGVPHQDHEGLVKARYDAVVDPKSQFGRALAHDKWLATASEKSTFCEVRSILGSQLTIQLIRILWVGDADAARKWLEESCGLKEPMLSHLTCVSNEAVNYVKTIGPFGDHETSKLGWRSNSTTIASKKNAR